MAYTSKEPLHVIEGFSEYQLTNGLRVVLYPEKSESTVTTCVTYRVGSRFESYGETGMAHLLEHLMFKGSTNIPNPTKEFTDRGFIMNGSTTIDYTNYFLTFQNSDDNLEWALSWHADSMVNSFIAQKDLDTEMTVVRNEYEMGENSPVSVLVKRVQAVAFDWHNNGHTTIGARSDIENVRIENLKAFYQKYYQPDNATFVVTGNFDVETILPLIDKTLGQIPRPTRVLPAQWTVEPVQDGEREVVVRRRGDVKYVIVAYHTPSALDDDWQPLSTGSEALSEGPRSRLFKGLVKTGLATSVGCWPWATRDPNLVFFFASVDKDKDHLVVRDEMIRLLETSLEAEPLTAEDVEPLLAEELSNFTRELSDPSNLAVELSSYIALGDWRIRFADRETIRQVTLDQVNDTVKRWFVPSNRIVGLFIPEEEPRRAPETSTMDVETLLSRFTFKAENDFAGEDFDTDQDNINALTKRFKVGEMNVALLPKKSAGQAVNVQLALEYGNLWERKYRPIASVMNQLFRCGTSKYTREEIEDRFIAYEMEGDCFNFQTNRKHVAEAIRFVGELLSDPVFKEEDFKEVVAKDIMRFQSYINEPMMLIRNAFTKHNRRYDPSDVRYQLTSEESIEALKALTLDELKAYWTNVFNTAFGSISVVGDFDLAEVEKALVEGLVGQKRANVTPERPSLPYEPMTPARLLLDAPEKDSGAVVFRRDFEMEENDLLYPAYMIANYIIGGSPGLSHRLAVRIRQQGGLSYAVMSQFSTPQDDHCASFVVMAMAAPQNLAQVEAKINEELALLVKEGITQDELDKAKFGYNEMRTINRTKDYNLASVWNAYMRKGKDWSVSKACDQIIADLTVEDVNAVIRQMCAREEGVMAIAGDLKKCDALKAQ